MHVPQSFAEYSPTKSTVTSHSESTPNQSQSRVTEAKPGPELHRDPANQEESVSFKKFDRRDQPAFQERRYPYT